MAKQGLFNYHLFFRPTTIMLHLVVWEVWKVKAESVFMLEPLRLGHDHPPVLVADLGPLEHQAERGGQAADVPVAEHGRGHGHTCTVQSLAPTGRGQPVQPTSRVICSEQSTECG